MASVLSSGEKRIVAVLSTCYGLMIDDNIKELYIDQETTSMVDKIRSDLYDLLSDYVKHGPEVEKYSKVIDNKLKRDNRDYCISNTQLAMTLLYLSFEKCEKSFKKLPTKIAEWYQDNRATILEISYRSCDSAEFKDSDEGSYLLAHTIMDAIRG